MEGDGREDIITFKRLSVKVREYILTDGLRNHNINWKDYGPALPAREWHKEIDALSSDNPDTRTVLLGNAYHRVSTLVFLLLLKLLLDRLQE